MSRRNVIIGIMLLAAFGIGSVVGVLGYTWSTGGLTEESQDVGDVAPTLSLDNPTATPNEVAQLQEEINQLNATIEAFSAQATTMADAASSPAEPQTTPEATAAPAESAAENEDITEEPPGEAENITGTAERALYRISGDDSEVRFLIDEVLAGNPATVTAATNRVAGDFIVDFANPSASQVGTIAINARTFRTDNEFRDNSIRGQILSTNQFEFIEFAPTELAELPSTPVEVGSTVEFQIVGDLTIKDVTRRVTFDAQVTLVDENRIEGSATAKVLYDDFGITIRTPPLVSEVGDEVTMELDFVAMQVEQ